MSKRLSFHKMCTIVASWQGLMGVPVILIFWHGSKDWSEPPGSVSLVVDAAVVRHFIAQTPFWFSVSFKTCSSLCCDLSFSAQFSSFQCSSFCRCFGTVLSIFLCIHNTNHQRLFICLVWLRSKVDVYYNNRCKIFSLQFYRVNGSVVIKKLNSLLFNKSV